jgi:hypothetical protein
MWPYRGRGARVGAGLHPRRASGWVSRAGVHDASDCCLFSGVKAVAEEASAQTTTRWRMMVIFGGDQRRVLKWGGIGVVWSKRKLRVWKSDAIVSARVLTAAVRRPRPPLTERFGAGR